MQDKNRRSFLRHALAGFTAVGTGSLWSTVLLAGCSSESKTVLGPPDENGIRLPAGLRSRVIARSSEPVTQGGAYRWHAAPDGGACFATPMGGWIYVSNSEMSDGGGGVGAIVFDSQATIIDAYSILSQTDRNCAGGATPWGTWLSCEETDQGRVWECYPDGSQQAMVRPALGVFNHEAVAVDHVNRHLYLTEDKTDGCLYRFIPDSAGDPAYDLAQGRLQVAVVDAATSIVNWFDIPDPSAGEQTTREQVADATRFTGGEGIAYHDGQIVFTTKGDNRVWRLDTASQVLSIIYDAADHVTPLLTGVDNVTVSESGDIYVAEDGGDMQIVVLDDAGGLRPLLQIEGHAQSEITGPAFSPDGKRLYFSSQRGANGVSEAGISYEISGF